MSLRLMAVLAHPDDESLGFGGTLAKYASEGVEVFLVTATRGERGRYREHRPQDAKHPGAAKLGEIREAELRQATAVLGIAELSILGYPDADLDRVSPDEAITTIAAHIRRIRPDVVVTFGPEGAYGHPDHIAISQFAAAAIVSAADARVTAPGGAAPHAVTKFYYLAWPQSTWTAYQEALKKLVAVVDGVERQATPWPDWTLTTMIDTSQHWATVWRAVSCHESQIGVYARLQALAPEHHEALWGRQSFYRVFSRVNGGRMRESDLFEGITT